MNFLFQHNTLRYSINDFIFRLKKIQKIVDKEDIDGLLIIMGVDSNHNFESIKLINWLFLGSSGIETEQNEYINENFNEMIFLIKKKGITSIFCEPPLYETLKSFLIIVPNIEIFCPTDKEYDNKDNMELIKITQFIKMVKDLKTIGVLLEQKNENNVNNVEKWPLVQAYGQADLGYGFFTMDHKIVSLSKRMNAVYKNHDKYSLEKLFLFVSSRLSNHIENAFIQINGTKFNKRVAISEEQLCDILKDSYEISELGKFIREPTKKTMPKPRILFGINTSKPFDLGSGPDTFLSASNNKPNPAFHATVEFCDIASKLRVGRTYFMTKNIKKDIHVENVLDDMDDLVNYHLGSIENDSFPEEEMMINLYIALIISCYESFHGFSQNYKLLTQEFVEQNIAKTVGKVYSAFHENQALEKKNINVVLNCYNSFGEEISIDFKDSISFKLTPYIYVLRAQINEIKSPINNKRDMGSLLFCESFLIQEGCFLLLTKETKYINLWNINPEITDQIQNMRITINANELGQCLTKGVVCENNRVFFPHEKLANYQIELPILPSKLILYEKGLKIYNEQIGWMIVLFKNTSEFYFNQTLEKPWIILKLDENILGQSLKCNRICIEMAGNSLSAIFFKFKEIALANGVKFQEIKDVPSFFLSSNAIKSEPKIFPETHVFPSINMNKSQILNPKLLFSYLESKQLVILNKLADLKLSNYKPLYEDYLIGPTQTPITNNSQIQIIIINGSHCSGKKRFSENLLRYEQEFFPLKFHLLSFKNYELPNLDEIKLLKKLVDFSVEHKINKNNIIFIVQPAKLNTVVLLEMLEKYQELSSKFTIKCIITKININNMFENLNKQFVKKVLGFAIEGYSQFLILDSYGNPETQIDQWNKLLKTALPKSNLFRIMNNIVPMSIVQDIMKYEGFYLEKNKFERLKNAVFCVNIDIIPQNSYIFIPFHVPIIREKINLFHKEIMRKNDGFLNQKKEISKEEKEKAEKSRDLLAMELLKLKELLMDMDQKMSKKTPHIIYIKALVRFYKALEEGLWEITITSNYYIERNLKNVKTIVKKEKISENLETEKAIYENLGDLKLVGFLFHGENLHEKKLMELLWGICQLKQREKVKLLKKDDISEEIRKKIEFEKRGVGLEDGDFYDGSVFRNNYGNILPCHPKLEEFVDEYLKERNKEIIKQNELIEKEGNILENSFKLF